MLTPASPPPPRISSQPYLPHDRLVPFLPHPGPCSVYASGVLRYVDFCRQDDRLYSLNGALLPAHKKTLIHFATLLPDSLNHLCWIGRPGRGVLNGGMFLLGHSSSSFNHSSINVYLSAVQSLHINNGLPDPLTNILCSFSVF